MCIAKYYVIYMVIYGFKLRCACILVFPEVMEYLYMSIAELWCHLFPRLDVLVCLHSPKLWSACI
jgi:hypothetical protein